MSLLYQILLYQAIIENKNKQKNHSYKHKCG